MTFKKRTGQKLMTPKKRKHIAVSEKDSKKIVIEKATVKWSRESIRKMHYLREKDSPLITAIISK